MNAPLVFVALGTDHHQFDRVAAWASQLASQDASVDWFLQAGFTSPPAGIASSPMLGVDELEDKLRSARVVVTHGGPGLILEARAHGHTPIVIPRDPARSEHVDNHQMLFTARLAAAERIHRVTEFDDFRSCVAMALLEGPSSAIESDVSDVSAVARLADHVDTLIAARAGKRHGVRWPSSLWRNGTNPEVPTSTRY